MNTEIPELNNIYYIDVPENFEGTIGEFKIDKKIKLPIETNGIDNWDPTQLSWEMFMSAMLKILAYRPSDENVDYYRSFILAVRPNIVQELTDSAIFKSNSKDFDLAKEIFLAIQGVDPLNDRNLLNLAVLYEKQAEALEMNVDEEKVKLLLEHSFRIYSDLLDNDTVLTDTYFNAGFFFIKIREFEKAETCLKSFIEYSDDDEKIKKAQDILHNYRNISGNQEIFNKAYRLIIEEKEHEAINLLLDFIETNDTIWNIWFLLGWAYRRISNFTESIDSLNKCIELNSKDADTYNEIAICYLELGDYKSSQKSLEKALMINPEDVKVISNLGILQLKQGNKFEAKRFFEAVLVYEPDDSIAKYYLNQIN